MKTRLQSMMLVLIGVLTAQTAMAGGGPHNHPVPDKVLKTCESADGLNHLFYFARDNGIALQTADGFEFTLEAFRGTEPLHNSIDFPKSISRSTNLFSIVRLPNGRFSDVFRPITSVTIDANGHDIVVNIGSSDPGVPEIVELEMRCR
ncbi:MAG: hypothetical protein EOP05_07695 [Proteobacteria bacterium]|nr:MAG: hypothetical protein EOP05_07695 [Pseudomonadota bacterium]